MVSTSKLELGRIQVQEDEELENKQNSHRIDSLIETNETRISMEIRVKKLKTKLFTRVLNNFFIQQFPLSKSMLN